MQMQDIEFDGDGTEVLDLDEAATSTVEDRGDMLPGEADAQTLKAIVDDAAADADLTDPDIKPAGGKIPKSRLDEVINQRETIKSERDALKEQLAEAQRQLQASKPTDGQTATTPTAAPSVELKALRTQYREALMDGDIDKAEALDDLIDAEVLRVAEDRFEQRQASRASQTALQTASAQAVADFPYLETPDGQEAVELIIMARDRRIANGMNASQALREAVATIGPRFQPDSEQGTPQHGLISTPKPTDTRIANALVRGAADSNQQPPSIQAGVGNRATAARVDVSKMSEEQFDSLPEAEKKRLRGD